MNQRIEQREVSKLVSLNPDRFEMIPMELAKSRYIDYVHSCKKTDMKANQIKDFNVWLLTEI